MKTKIIYISGNEVFEMSEIRAAFDEVRSALGLDNDTILFGVPVDSDNALESDKTIEMQQRETVCATVNEENDAELNVQTPQIQPQEIAENEVCEEIITEAPEIEDIVDTTEDFIETFEPAVKEEEKIIPILSILAANQNHDLESETINEIAVDETSDEVIAADQIAENDEPETSVSAHTNQVEKISIDDMVDAIPVAREEKTLEQLLESMTPLREDVEHNVLDYSENNTTEAFDMDVNDTDATLAQLASEFAENEDKIISSSAKAEPQGKIGKLKNILPFKKAKRDDGGLMGDLFGWAGIAANDDDFTMPGFFTGAKKQGA